MSSGKVIKYVIGIDEVGRGPLAGPVTVCGFVIAKSQLHLLRNLGITDSKKISPQKREVVMEKLKELKNKGYANWYLASNTNEYIDKHGLTKSLQSAIDEILKKVEKNLETNPTHMDIYLDGSLHADKRYFRQHTIIGGDDKELHIGAASIIAKIHRDKFMEDMDLFYPEYGFYNHKGYGTKEHYMALKKHGPCKIHRRSFLKDK